MVTIYAASLTFNNPTFCPHNVFMCFVWIWEQTAIISPFDINHVVFVADCVYLLWSRKLIFISYNSKNVTYTRSLNGSGGWSSVSFVARARGLIPDNSKWYLYQTKTHRNGFISERFALPLSVPFRHCSTLIFIYCWSYQTNKQARPWRAADRKVLLPVSVYRRSIHPQIFLCPVETCAISYRGLFCDMSLAALLASG